MIKLKRLLMGFLILPLIFTMNKAFASYDKLNKKNYQNAKDEKAVVIYGANWGRQWGCAGLDNAQLQNITFSNVNNKADDITLTIPSKLLSEDISKPHAIIVNPGEYALSGFDIRIGRAMNQVDHIKWTDDGNSNGGSFKVNAGEVVYIGDFGLDCTKKPILWRYYIQKNDFDRFVSQFKKEYKFIANKEVIYRLFQTNMFGQ